MPSVRGHGMDVQSVYSVNQVIMIKKKTDLGQEGWSSPAFLEQH